MNIFKTNSVSSQLSDQEIRALLFVLCLKIFSGAFRVGGHFGETVYVKLATRDQCRHPEKRLH